MDNSTFFKTIIDALGADQSIQDWGQLNFASAVSIFVDISTEDPPGADDCPYMLIHRPGVEKSLRESVSRYHLDIDLVINKEGLEVRVDDVEKPSGIDLIMEFTSLVIDCIKDNLPTNMLFGYETRSDTLGSLPDVLAYIHLTFWENVLIGTSPI